MHSSRMRTVHSSSRLFRGDLPQCMLGYPPGADTPPNQAPAPRVVTPRDQAPPRKQTLRDQAPPWTRHPPCGQTDTCKNIAFVTSLRTVITIEKGPCLRDFVFVFLETRLLQLQKGSSLTSKNLR